MKSAGKTENLKSDKPEITSFAAGNFSEAFDVNIV